MVIATPEISEDFAEQAQNDFALGDDIIQAIEDAVNEDRNAEVVAKLDILTAQDTAELISKSDDETRTRLLGHFLEHIDANALSYLDSELQKEILSSLQPEQVALIIAELESDDALDLIENLDPVFPKRNHP